MRFTAMNRWRGAFVAAMGFAWAATAGAAPAALREPAVATAVPRTGDHTLLSWREGPPYFTGARYSSDRRFLRLETGHFTAEFDTERIAVVGFQHLASARDDTAATQAALAAEPLPAAQLDLRIRVGNTVYSCTGRRRLPLDAHGQPTPPLDFPVRVIESGRLFQKFALHDLEFHDASGKRLPVDARLEIAAWPERMALTLIVRPEQALTEASAFIRLRTAGGIDASSAEAAASWPAAGERRSVLTLTAEGSALSPAVPPGLEVRVEATDPRGAATVQWNREELCHTVRLAAPPWPEPTEGHYPASMLDAWETFTVSVENHSAEPRRVALKFDYAPVKAITGYVPMILDTQDRPVGIPVQVSKNWHQVGDGVDLPYAGPWMHGRTWLNLEPNARLTFRYGTTFARWGGVPAASLAQLSLVGWGYNGFWDQFALGAFGESFCFQPGRTMRRALLTDFRPLLQRGFARDERWSWTSNVGGGDTMVRFDPQGHYVPFKRNATRYVSHGPNLAHLTYEELSADTAVRSRVDVYLPRTDDAVRVVLRVRYDVSRRVAFSRLALFQLGADYYNEPDASRIAWGDIAGRRIERSPKPEAGAGLLPLWEARGSDPWISLHGEARNDAARTGQASRGLIVREWKAVLGGRAVPAPFFAAVGSRGTKARLAAEIVAPPGVSALEAGDHVEMLIELVALPLSAERYYGPDEALRAALAADANTWKMVQREAAANRPRLRLADGTEVRGWPLTVPAGDGGEAGFTLQGGLGWVPMRLTGLTRPDAVELFRVTRAGRERVVQGDPARPFWQTDYDVGSKRWGVTFNLPATESPTHFVAALRTQEAPTEAAASAAEPAGR